VTEPATSVPHAFHVEQKRGASPYPALPEGWGAVEVTFHFDSMVTLERDGKPVTEWLNWANWIDPPTLTIDGNERRAGWSVWAYPLPAGPHVVRFRTPVFAERRVEVSAGQVTRLKYDADLMLYKDQDNDVLGGPIRETTATVKVRALKSRPAT
jgi:hypothetical protein